MDQIAIISDIHGNMPALDVVMTDIQRRGIDQIYCLGDLVGKGPDSDQTVDICREQCTGIVRGNWDAFITKTTSKPTRHWHQERLGDQRLAYLQTLPGTIDLTISGQHVRFFHASQQSEHHRVYYWDDFKKLKAMFKNTPFTGNRGSTPDMVIYGDIHEAFMLPVAGKRLVNVGSVGNPTDRIPMAGYLILRGQLENSIRSEIGIEFVRLNFDIEGAIEIARAARMPKLAEYAFELRNGRYRKHMPEGYTP